MAATDYSIQSMQLRADVDRLKLVIDGDLSTDVKGLRPRVVDIETVIELWAEEKRVTAAWRKGVAIGLAVQLVTTGGVLGVLLKLVSEVLAKHP